MRVCVGEERKRERKRHTHKSKEITSTDTKRKLVNEKKLRVIEARS